MTATRRLNTRQREAVRQALSHTDEFVSAQALHAMLREQGESVGLATVYRTLAAFAADGEADALQNEGEHLYRACTPTHHHHLICRNCGKTAEISAEPIEAWAQSVAAAHGFIRPSHVVDVFGLCTDCAKLLGESPA